MPRSKLSIPERLAAASEPRGECIVWTGATVRRYGRITIDGKQRYAHCVAFELATGQSARGTTIRHSCDNPPCINPAHLRSGTQLDNVRDMWERGRARRLLGEANGKAKLTAEQAAEIRRRFVTYDRANGTRAMAREFGVSHQSIGAVVRGESHKAAA